MRTIIYCVYDLDGDIRYVGKTTQTFAKRMVQHKHDAFRRNRNHRTNWFRQCYRVGYEPVTMMLETIEGTNDEGAEAEIQWIKHYRQIYDLVNCTEGGEGRLGCSPSDETREKLRKARLGYRHSEETKRKIASGNKNKKISCEHKEKLRKAAIARGADGIKQLLAANIGSKHTPEHIEKIRSALAGRKLSDEHKRRIGLAGKKRVGPLSSMYGKNHSPETIEKMRQAGIARRQGAESIQAAIAANIGSKHTPEHKAKIAEGVRRARAIRFWSSGKTATLNR